MRNITTEYTAANQVSETASATICAFAIGHMKEFDITIRESASSGFNYNVYVTPEGASSVIKYSATSVASTKNCATYYSTIRNNNMNYCWIEAEATAAARETSASDIRIIVSSIERE